MRNLKRALSLALAFVMVMSMMVVGAGAVSIDDFSDKDQIVNTEAVMTTGRHHCRLHRHQGPLG